MIKIVAVNGLPALFFEFLPNWRDPVERELSYKTDIFESYHGFEQRRALRTTARRSFSFTMTRSQDNFREIMSVLAGWQRKLFLLADPTRSIRVLEEMSSFANKVASPAAPWITVGAHVALEYRGRMEYRKVLSIDGQDVFFDATGVTSWPLGTNIRPVYPARLMEGVNSRVFTSTVSEPQLDFSVEPTFPVAVVDRGSGAIFGGLEVLLKKPNWASPLGLDISATLEALDFGRGARTVIAPTNFSSRTQRMDFLARDAEEIEDAEAFFHRMKGRRGSFYMPSGTKDMRVISDVLAGSYGMVAALGDSLSLLDEDPAHRSIVLETANGYYFNRIEDLHVITGGYGLDYGLSYGLVQDLSGTTDRLAVITLAEPWPVTLTPAQIRYASWLLCCRLGSDSLTFKHATEDVAQYQMTIMQIRDQHPTERYLPGWGYSYGTYYGGEATP